MAKLKI